ncbi:MAG: heparan-alpha-glucosaminide N-acetyltransferase [Bdellovibrionota bacterium]
MRPLKKPLRSKPNEVQPKESPHLSLVSKNHTPRYPEIDLLRGLAVIAMILYHLSWDIDNMGVGLNFSQFTWDMGATLIGSTFLFLVGLSSWIEKENYSSANLYKKTARKFIRTFFAALMVSAISFAYMPRTPIYFGILHCISASYLALIVYQKAPRPLVLASTILILVLGNYFYFNPLQNPQLFWFAMSDFKGMADYYPFLPWSGVALLGYFCGKYLSPILKERNSKEEFLKQNKNKPHHKTLTFLGKHSLIIYLVHQPILIFLLNSLGVIN